MQVHELYDPWAPHPVVNKNICFGGGGGGQYNAPVPQAPDYTNYIKAMSDIGNQGTSWARELMDWAKTQGVDLTNIAKTVSEAAGKAASGQQQAADELMQEWRGLSKPLYEAQQRDALRMIQDLPTTEEQYAGKYGADAAMAIDQQKASAVRAMEARGLAPNAAATGALDTSAATQRALATTAAAESGRGAARTEARNVTGQALTQEQAISNVSTAQGALATQNRTQQADVPNKAASTAAALYQPSMGFYSAAYPYMAQWGQAQGQQFNQQLASWKGGMEQAKQNAEAESGSDWLGTLGGIAGGIAGSYLGPMGSAMGSKLGSMAGSGASSWMGSNASSWKASGTYEKGGAIDTVPPSASPSGGRRTDDVHAALSVGEFVMPKRTVDWYGDKFFHKLIDKADKEQGLPPQDVGPEMGPQNSAIMTQPPMFRSEGART